MSDFHRMFWLGISKRSVFSVLTHRLTGVTQTLSDRPKSSETTWLSAFIRMPRSWKTKDPLYWKSRSGAFDRFSEGKFMCSYAAVRAIKWVDEVYENAPYTTQLSVLNEVGAGPHSFIMFLCVILILQIFVVMATISLSMQTDLILTMKWKLRGDSSIVAQSLSICWFKDVSSHERCEHDRYCGTNAPLDSKSPFHLWRRRRDEECPQIQQWRDVCSRKNLHPGLPPFKSNFLSVQWQHGAQARRQDWLHQVRHRFVCKRPDV